MVNLTTTTKSVLDPTKESIEEIQTAAKPGTLYFHLFRLQDALRNVRSRVVWYGVVCTHNFSDIRCSGIVRHWTPRSGELY